MGGSSGWADNSQGVSLPLPLSREGTQGGWDPQLLTNGKVKADVVFEVDRARRMQRV